MAILQFSTTLRNNRVNQFEATLGASAKLRIMSGTKPANCEAVDVGLLLCEMLLPADYMSAAASGIASKQGTWSGLGTAAAGAGTTATYFRIKNNAGTIVHCQGDLSVTGGGGAITIDDTNVVEAQPLTVTGFTLVDGNA